MTERLYGLKKSQHNALMPQRITPINLKRPWQSELRLHLGRAMSAELFVDDSRDPATRNDRVSAFVFRLQDVALNMTLVPEAIHNM